MISERLKYLRKKAGFTQSEVAAAIHKDTSAYCKIEQGQSKLDAELVPVFCSLYQIGVEEFFGNSDGLIFHEKVENKDNAMLAYNIYEDNRLTIQQLQLQLNKKDEQISELIAFIKLNK